jgi:hypothetical protein
MLCEEDKTNGGDWLFPLTATENHLAHASILSGL